MSAADLDYARLVRDALRAVPRAALALVAESGLPAGHALYLTFATTADGVELPPALRQIYPQQMTVVLERQYWNLEVGPTEFAVTLSFGGQRQRISVPFAALSGFSDPGAEFGLRLDAQPVEAGDMVEPPAAPAPQPPLHPVPGGGEVVPFDRPRKR